MGDTLTAEQRRFNMSRIRGKDTKLEMLIRRGLHARGLRYRLHDRSLPGRPDLVFPKFHAAVFVHGCFWHSHGCVLAQVPATRQAFWKANLAANVKRDNGAVEALRASGWRVLVIWECAVRGLSRRDSGYVLDAAAVFLRGSLVGADLPGDWNRKC
ncbi:very short patch repair endonuclease [Acidiferrobacter thiooxydans]|jgi:DNA mismatch endonuclease (patch repair protein)|uniref:Very short patch repair endonuclease n=1 Tax=Acidiferrobacter thiooxydans TaxID=163359 RepID=A0A1C2FWX1_9GAMM|nr:very short patch repair endonuclease [Acidiferrobacter thiooxydans]RCN55796.1 very short patch repair endonuclease [Acidiferrobacter thiooxydans]UEN98386.1 very short patch repair endonuclease [Acidiferrobacter thiooxydans]